MLKSAVDSLEHCPAVDTPVILTLGTFDGVHLGHQSVLKEVQDLAQDRKTLCAAITFQKHPTVVLRPDSPKLPIASLDDKIRLLQHYGIHLVLALAFTEQLSQLSAVQFLSQVQDRLPFQVLVLGHDARLGHDRIGETKELQCIADHLGFELLRVPPYASEGLVVSSTRIREALRQGKLEEAKAMQGRPVSFYGIAEGGQGLGKTLGFPTLNFSVDGLCLPPLGVYAVKVCVGDQVHDGVANLGRAPTLRDDDRIWLEVHLFSFHSIAVEVAAEVQLLAFLRPEKRFESTQMLQSQIQQDLREAQAVLGQL